MKSEINFIPYLIDTLLTCNNISEYSCYLISKLYLPEIVQRVGKDEFRQISYIRILHEILQSLEVKINLLHNIKKVCILAALTSTDVSPLFDISYIVFDRLKEKEELLKYTTKYNLQIDIDVENYKLEAINRLESFIRHFCSSTSSLLDVYKVTNKNYYWRKNKIYV